MNNPNFSIDLRLLNTRKQIELQSITTDNRYEALSQEIAINKKYEVIIEALKGLYELGIQYSVKLSEIIETYSNI
jgi:hypothetical protein